jgi:hypothetical protein
MHRGAGELNNMKRANVYSTWSGSLVAAAAGAAVVAAVLVGCQGDRQANGPNGERPQTQLEAARGIDAGLVSAVRDSAVKNAIITEHTLYPYHFEPGGPELNELGQRDVAVLAEHFSARPGTLNVRRGDAASTLYDARMDTVRRELAHNGVALDAVRIADASAGGTGVLGERVKIVLERERNVQPYYENEGGQGASNTQNASGSGKSSGSR